MEKINDFEAKKITLIPQEERMTIDKKRAEIKALEESLVMKQAELNELEQLGLKSEAEEAERLAEEEVEEEEEE